MHSSWCKCWAIFTFPEKQSINRGWRTCTNIRHLSCNCNINDIKSGQFIQKASKKYMAYCPMKEKIEQTETNRMQPAEKIGKQ